MASDPPVHGGHVGRLYIWRAGQKCAIKLINALRDESLVAQKLHLGYRKKCTCRVMEGIIIVFRIGLTAIALVCASGAVAQTVYWTDWQTASAGTATGSIAAPSGVVNVTHTGGYSFVNTGVGNPWWSVGTYNGTLNRPFDNDIVALAAGGLKTVSFDTPVVDPYMALMSWNGNNVVFSAPFTVFSNGSGWWGSGTPIVNAASDGFIGSGEVHAILQFKGTFTSLSFTDSSENWHGYTVGIADRASSGPVVPEPATWALLISGFTLVGAALRQRTRRQLKMAMA